MKRIPVYLLTLLVVGITACSEDETVLVHNNPIRTVVSTRLEVASDTDSDPLQLSFRISTDPAALVPDNQPATIRSANTVVLKNARLFQFNSQGLLFANESLGDISDGETIAPKLTTGLDQILYLVANAGETDFSSVKNLASFEAMTFPVDKITSDEQIPVVGCLRGVEIRQTTEGEGSIILPGDETTFLLRRIASKIVFNYSFEVENLELNSIALVDAPAVMSFVEPEADGILTFYPEAIVDANFETFEKSDLSASEKKRGSFTWYISDNIRGVIEEHTQEQQKNRLNAPDRSTYILLSAKMADGMIVRYRLYPGGNNSGDYNLFRNRIYTLSALIDGKDPTVDQRIETEMPPIIVKPDYAEPANCYIVAPGKQVVINPYKASGDVDNKHLTGKTIASAEILWQTRYSNALALGNAAAVVLNEKEGQTLLTVTANEAATDGGNAVVAVKDQSGQILWSWHIWVTSYDPETDNFAYNGSVWMTRSLGALSATPGESGVEGWLYQWGRKDPFPPATDASHSTVMLYNASGNTLPEVSDVTGDRQIAKAAIASLPGGGISNLDYAIANPTTLICNGAASTSTTTAPVHWISSDVGSDAITSNLWNASGKTIYDPCPAGWIISSTEFYNTALKHNSSVAGAISTDPEHNGAYVNVLDKKSVWFPYQGSRKSGTGVVSDYGENVNVWTGISHADAKRTWTALISTAAFKMMITTPRSDACVVRCVKDE